MLVWTDPYRQPVCRFGIAGDFLPAAGLSPIGGETWSGQATLLAPIFGDLEFAVVNFECPVSVKGISPRVKASLGDSLAAEAESLDYLAPLNASAVCVANN